MDRNVKDSSRLNSSSFCSRSDGFESVSSHNAKQHASLVEWMNAILPDLHLPANASDEEIRDVLIDGSVLCRILKKIKPGSIFERDTKSHGGENVERFLYAMDEMGLPRFQVADLKKGLMKKVLACLSTLRMHYMMRFSRLDSSNSGWKSTASVISHAGHNFHDVLQLKHGSYADIPAATMSEMMKSNSLNNAPIQSLLSVVNGILDEGVEMKSGAIPHRVACLFRKVVQEIERRICTQAENLRTVMRFKTIFSRREKRTTNPEFKCSKPLQRTRGETQHEASKLVNEKEDIDQGVANLRQRLDTRGIQQELLERLNEALFLLTKSGARIKDLEATEAKDERNQQELENRPTEETLR
ncbi:hypothetical protein SASPL_115036 [Salvia splendens]|uniref:Calponin-homology (CH) domain-containing protein n=1 Tax=Salvia splendens TaxID=180675 RepID=A0A8X9A190_SALSN|nr:hypothetical protein SASPL_115036 [Salvia splendens]